MITIAALLASISVVVALMLDLKWGDPPSRYHPTAWVGGVASFLIIKMKSIFYRQQRLGGTILTVLLAGTVFAALYFFSYYVSFLVDNISTADYTVIISSILFVASFSVLLKTTIALKGIQNHSVAILQSLEKNEFDKARNGLSMLVKRNTKNFDKRLIISGTLESIGENIVDGVTGPLFYFTFFGLPGAFVHRTINTFDSMIGYKTEFFIKFGWFAANSDKLLNFIPARLTAVVMVLAAAIRGLDWKGAIETIRSDAKNTESPNAGYPMSALAGALCVRLEKPGHYVIGEGKRDPLPVHFEESIKLVRTCSVLFICLFAVPLIFVLSYLGWWW